MNEQPARLMEKHVALELRLEHWRATGHALVDGIQDALDRGDYEEAERLLTILAPTTDTRRSDDS